MVAGEGPSQGEINVGAVNAKNNLPLPRCNSCNGLGP